MKQNIIPFEKIKFEDNEICVDEVEITYSQNPDNSGLDKDGEDDLAQEITISTRNNGLARYINIKTASWSISDIDELIQLIDDFKKRAFLEDEDDSCN